MKIFTLINAEDAQNKFNDLSNIRVVPVSKYNKFYSGNGSDCYAITQSDTLSNITSIAILKIEGRNKYMYFMDRYWKVLDKSTSNLLNTLASLVGRKKHGLKEITRKPFKYKETN